MTTATATAVQSNNYPQSMIDSMVARYTEAPVRATVDTLAVEFDKTPRSVIAKLSALGVYVAAAKPTKRPAKVTKADLVATIEQGLGIEFQSLGKAGFGDLTALVLAIETLKAS
jgi:hypothetical protein|tara:strand:- start:155 stop:496 length:342 start_codon:yes stop_codon:yes gene_type:complete